MFLATSSLIAELCLLALAGSVASSIEPHISAHTFSRTAHTRNLTSELLAHTDAAVDFASATSYLSRCVYACADSLLQGWRLIFEFLFPSVG